ncbi:amidohydrolase family protein [Paracoccus salsus]|uniref:amidohydrolase family protein n=1 Tax=Paracoccus salsus TaxID=2911061 RepID=UPI001F202ED3|nr:amidohydrolase family protein [Paracoccus salsus]MCF3974542.1 amidohydrolase [Paracoccus salsus]
MLSRRRFVHLALGSTALSGCGISGLIQPGPQTDLPGIPVDAHMHLFNGADVPVIGWLTQVDFTAESGGSLPDITKSPLVRLIVSFLANATPTAGAELARLPARLPRPSQRQMRDEGVDRLAVFLERYQDAVLTGADDPDVMELLSAGSPVQQQRRVEDQQLFADLAAAAGLAPPEIAAEPVIVEEAPAITGPMATRRAAPPPAPPAPAPSTRQIAEGLFDPRNQRGDPLKQTLAGMVQWAELMTRPRAQIMQQAVSLYGRPTELRVFCNHLLDIGYWLRADEVNQSHPDDLITLFAELSARRSDVLVLNFVGFCPLRAAIEGDSAHDRVRRAVTRNGFAGVKLYPPMGFKPLENAGVGFSHARVTPPGRGTALDRELRKLYAWCQANDVPIAAHASASMGAGPGTAGYSAPWLWRPVLRDYPDLRVNLAHFGGFGGHGNPQWENELIAMLDSSPNLYFDSGFWTEAMAGAPTRPEALRSTRALFASEPLAAQRMLYGSDWSMIARLPSHPAYLAGLTSFVDAVTGDARQSQAIMGGNARRWLGLDRDGAQRQRLARFHGRHPVWAQLAA